MRSKTSTIELPREYVEALPAAARLDAVWCMTFNDMDGIKQHIDAQREAAYYDSMTAALARLEEQAALLKADRDSARGNLYREPTPEHADQLLAITMEGHALRGGIDYVYDGLRGWAPGIEAGIVASTALNHGQRARLDKVCGWGADTIAQLRAGQALKQQVADPTGMGIDLLVEALMDWRSPHAREADLQKMRDRDLAMNYGSDVVDGETGQVTREDAGIHVAARGVAANEQGVPYVIR